MKKEVRFSIQTLEYLLDLMRQTGTIEVIIEAIYGDFSMRGLILPPTTRSGLTVEFRTSPHGNELLIPAKDIEDMRLYETDYERKEDKKERTKNDNTKQHD